MPQAAGGAAGGASPQGYQPIFGLKLAGPKHRFDSTSGAMIREGKSELATQLQLRRISAVAQLQGSRQGLSSLRRQQLARRDVKARGLADKLPGAGSVNLREGRVRVLANTLKAQKGLTDVKKRRLGKMLSRAAFGARRPVVEKGAIRFRRFASSR